MRNRIRVGVIAAAIAAASLLTACGSSALTPTPTASPSHSATHSATPTTAPPIVVTPVPVPTHTVYVQPAPAPTLNSLATVIQFYADITDHDYSAAWNLGGKNLAGGMSFAEWENAYSSTTASITLNAQTSSADDSTVHADITALQLDGSIRLYTGTYTVQNGVIVSANIVRD